LARCILQRREARVDLHDRAKTHFLPEPEANEQNDCPVADEPQEFHGRKALEVHDDGVEADADAFVGLLADHEAHARSVFVAAHSGKSEEAREARRV